MIQCPICSQSMTHQSIHGVEVDICDAHGIFLDKGELLRITEEKRHADASFQMTDLFRREQRPPVDRGRDLGCPHCDKVMAIEEYEGVHIDWCASHGIWLDNGELDAILSNLRLDPRYVGKVALRLWEARY